MTKTTRNLSYNQMVTTEVNQQGFVLTVVKKNRSAHLVFVIWVTGQYAINLGVKTAGKHPMSEITKRQHEVTVEDHCCKYSS